MVKVSNKDEFVRKARLVHGDRYNYDKFIYTRAIDKGIITCKKHGDFEQSPNIHLRGVGCPICGKEKGKGENITRQTFIERANELHGGRYTYEKVNDFKGNKSNVLITCPKHGDFLQRVGNHLNGRGCPKCANELRHYKMSKTREEFIEEAMNIHGNKYDYSKVDYVNTHTKVEIICPKHGSFFQQPTEHLHGRGCPKCVGRGRDKMDFVSEAIKVHGSKYDYSEVKYTKSEDKVTIKCNRCGSRFTQKPWVHLQGHGCPYCNMSRGEEYVDNLLLDSGMEYQRQVRLPFLSGMSLDFLVEGRIGIEVQGSQHFDGSREFGHKGLYEQIKERDIKKKLLCNENGIEILYYVYEITPPNQYIGRIITEGDELIREIRKEICT